MDFIHHWVQACSRVLHFLSYTLFGFLTLKSIFSISSSWIFTHWFQAWSSSILIFLVGSSSFLTFIVELKLAQGFFSFVIKFKLVQILKWSLSPLSSLLKFFIDLHHWVQAYPSSLLIFIVEFKLAQVLSDSWNIENDNKNIKLFFL